MNKQIEILTSILSIKELLFNEIRTVFKNEGLSSTELMIIYLLQHKHNEIRSGDLANVLYLPMSTLTGIIDKMIEKGIVLRKSSSEDRRVVIIKLNPEFKKRSEHCINELSKIMNEISTDFTTDWFNDFNEKLNSFRVALEKRDHR